MDDPGVSSRMVLLGHLLITIPAIAVIPLILYFGWYIFGPDLLLYYLCAGLAVSWQWYSAAAPRWKESLRKKNVQENEIEEIQRHTGLLWPGASTVGLFALHTTIAAICALRIGPWLVGHWFAWILPLGGRTSPSGFTAYSDYYLQHVELASILPALVIGYVVCRYLPKLATWAWVLPTLILSYKLLTFTDPQASVFTSHPLSRFSYYFVIVRLTPTFTDLRGSDPIRLVRQMTVVEPFYSGVAYSIGALLESHKMLERIIGNIFAEPEAEVFGTEQAGAESAVDANEEPVHERNRVP
ncbi:MAG: hypothetical protein ABSG40_12155 [Terriglobales bacterium]|jgi:hypothetical protein